MTKQKTTLYCHHRGDLEFVARQLLAQHPEARVFSLQGSMGAGKTTFIKEICALLGVDEEVNSPTFAIVNQYFTSSGESVYHFDLYRLKNPSELMDIGYEEYFFSGDYCFVEWPEKAKHLLPPGTVEIFIEPGENADSRIFRF